MRRALAFGGVIAAAALVLAAAAPMPQQTPNAGFAITHINNTPIQPGKITLAGEMNVLPGAFTADGTADVAVEQSVVNTGLANVDVLRAWALCAPELRMQAAILRGYAEAAYAFPKNAPLSHYANPAEDAVAAEEHRKHADSYDKAALLAEQSNVPCFKQGQAYNVGNYATLTGLDVYGNEITLHVPEYSAVNLPAEYFVYMGVCEQVLTKELVRIMAQPVDTVPGKRGSIDTFTERDKANAITALNAEIEMIHASGAGALCK